jgi:pimeloyl-ACP methyl ester carboxylesterase
VEHRVRGWIFPAAHRCFVELRYTGTIFLSIEGAILYTREAGPPGQPAIVFLHAGGLSSKSWLPVIERLPEFHCLAPDLPEQGQSKEIPYSIEGAAKAVAEIIRARVPAQKAHVIALSLGGPVAFTMLRTVPQLIDRVLISGGSGRVSPLLAAIGKSTIWMYRFFKPDWLVRETMRQHGIPEQYADLVRDDLMLANSPGFMRRYMTELARWELPESIQNPLLLVVGEKEMKAAFGFARGYLERFPIARGVVAPGARHAWSLQLPDLFADLVRAWVTGHPLPEGFHLLNAG